MEVDINNCDFSGWATRANMKCSDGRTIMKNAFIDNDGTEQFLTCTYNAKTGELIFEVSSTGSFTIEQA